MAEITPLPSNTCLYPRCSHPVDSRVEGRAGQWCKEHVDMLCHAPDCKEPPEPGADTCEEHHRFATLFHWMHTFTHQQWAAAAAQAQQQQAILNKVAGNGKGLPPTKLIRGR